MGYGVPTGNMMDGAGVEEQAGLFAQLMAKLPAPVQVLLHVLAVVVIAAIVGLVIGKMYASIKYPDPEKHHIISPKLKVLFICILAACCFWLYTTMSHEDLPEEMAPDTEQQVQSGEDVPVASNDVAIATPTLG